MRMHLICVSGLINRLTQPVLKLALALTITITAVQMRGQKAALYFANSYSLVVCHKK